MKKIRLQKMKTSQLRACAALASSNPFFKSYGMTASGLRKNLSYALKNSDHALTVALVGKDVAGFVWVMKKGAFGIGTYLRLIAVDGRFQGLGVGACLMDFFEKSRSSRHVFFLVTTRNKAALRFYKKRGYVRVGLMRNLLKRGFHEAIYYKHF